MGGGVQAVDRRVATGGDHASALYHDRAHGDFTGLGRPLRLGQGFTHETVIGNGGVGHAASVGQGLPALA